MQRAAAAKLDELFSTKPAAEIGYSLATESLPVKRAARTGGAKVIDITGKVQRARRDSNPRLSDSKSDALSS